MAEIKKSLDLTDEQLLVFNLPSELEGEFTNLVNVSFYQEVPNLTAPAEAVLVFASNWAELSPLLTDILHITDQNTVFWVSYPKRSSEKYKSDINHTSGWEILEEKSYRLSKQVSLSADWLALQFKKT